MPRNDGGVERSCMGPSCDFVGCPVGMPGPALVEVPTPSGTTICIDSTEVTSADYSQFLTARGGDTSGQRTECTGNIDFAPTCAAAGPEYPVVCVDWCDAKAYCIWARKHLCGAYGGSPGVSFVSAVDSEWYNACSVNGGSAYPYGDQYEGAVCVGSDYDATTGYQPATDAAHPVATAPSCHGSTPPFDRLFDMSGNVGEWQDSCGVSATATLNCGVVGGAFDGMALSCDTEQTSAPSTRAAADIGFRCCVSAGAQ